MSPSSTNSPLSRFRSWGVTVLMVVVSLLLFAPESTLAASPTPDPEQSFSVQINRILDILNPDSKASVATATASMAQMTLTLIKDSMLWAQKIHESLRGEANEIAATLLWAVLFAEITFTGFRLMLGSSIIEQLGFLTTKTFIYVIVSGLVVFPGAPAPYNSAEGIIRGSMFRLMHAGKYLGAELIKNAAHPNVQKIKGIKNMKVDKAFAVPPAAGWPPSSAYATSGGPLTGQDALGRSYRNFNNQWGDAGTFGTGSPTSGGGVSPAGLAEPMMYWLSWIGVEYANEYKAGDLGQPDYEAKDLDLKKALGEEEYKFSLISLNVRIWGEDPTKGDTVSQQLADNWKKNAKYDGDPTSGSWWKNILDSGLSTLEQTATGILLGTMPLQMFGIALSVAGVQIGSLITVTFAQISMLVGSITAFNIAASMGLAVLPLMYFRMFDKIWSQYLIGLGSLALIPFLFYLLSAVGFIFSTFVYEQLFPVPKSLGGSGADTPSLAFILNQMFFAAVQTTMTSFGLLLSGVGSALVFTISSLITIYITLGRIMFGCTIVAAFVSAGALFSLLAPRFAFRWQQGFGAEDVMEKIGEIFNNVQSAVGSGMGQMYADAISKGGQMGKGLAGGLLKPKGS